MSSQEQEQIQVSCFRCPKHVFRHTMGLATCKSVTVARQPIWDSTEIRGKLDTIPIYSIISMKTKAQLFKELFIVLHLVATPAVPLVKMFTASLTAVI